MASFVRNHLAALAALALPLVGCSDRTVNSTPLVTEVPHTDVKRQSIGNCWLYAGASWLESMLKTTTGEEVNASESYWTWWHWYYGLVGSSDNEVTTGGSWFWARKLMLERGLVLEGEFIPSEANAEMSARQDEALDIMNAALAEGGELANQADRTPDKVRAALDKAWGTNMAQAESLARQAKDVVVGKDGTTLDKALNQWTEVRIPRVYGKDAQLSASQLEQRQKILRRALTALNDHQPVVMTLMIDFGALSMRDDAMFEKAYLDANGSGRQGGHMVVLDDYVVDNVPGHGRIGEGNVSDELKKAALDGELVHLKAKNSWGKGRADRHLIDGYTRFDAAYLFSQLAWRRDGNNLDDTLVSHFSALTGFVIPPGY